jgi:hypothetical protein
VAIREPFDSAVLDSFFAVSAQDPEGAFTVRKVGTPWSSRRRANASNMAPASTTAALEFLRQASEMPSYRDVIRRVAMWAIEELGGGHGP